jgi:GNAT superfamily N-acetyltransferase
MIVRLAKVADLSAIERIVSDAYRVYIERIGKPPGPMLDDYSVHVRNHAAWVAEIVDKIVGVLILLDEADHLLLDIVAVDPGHHGRGIGRALLNFAEQEAVRRGYREITLYTHEKMSENLAMYPALGWEETGRREQNGYQRVFFRKSLGD